MIYHEKELNYCYSNKGNWGYASVCGYLMDMIRNLKPKTCEEWQNWYLANVHNDACITKWATEMYFLISKDNNFNSKGISFDECKEYFYSVMFDRTFNGYIKEQQALELLLNEVSPNIQESPKEWDVKYFIDF